MKLLFDCTWDGACPGGSDRVRLGALRLETRLREADVGRLRCQWAWWTLTMLDATIRSGDRLGVEVHLALGEREFG